MKKRNVILIAIIAAVGIIIGVMVVNAGIKTTDKQAAVSSSVSVETEPAWTAEPAQASTTTPTPVISASPLPSTRESMNEQSILEEEGTSSEESSSSGSGSDDETSPTETPTPQPTPTGHTPTGAPTPCPSEDAQQTIDDTHDWIDDNHPTPAPPDPDLPGIGNW